MIRGAIIFLWINYCALLFSQEDLRFSRNFEARKKNIPLQILNNSSSSFYVLRLNNVVHDITIERRSKPDAEIIAFTPLKLDSVNASWFDYENLDYLFFENEKKAYFLFEKDLNLKKTLYLKIIDSTGRSSGFTELASLEKDNTTLDIAFNYKRTPNNNILIVASKSTSNGLTRKVVLLFDIRTKRVIWTKKLPLEITASDFSSTFECNSENDLFYTFTQSTVTGYETYVENNIRYSLPALHLDSLFIIKWGHSSEFPLWQNIALDGVTQLRSGFIFAKDSTVLFSVQGIQETEKKDSTDAIIKNLKFNSRDLALMYSVSRPYDHALKKQLTFYDGPREEYFLKRHDFLWNYFSGPYIYTLSERIDGYYYKELLLRKTDSRTGEIIAHKVIPRKIFFFKNRTRFKSMGNVMSTFFGDSLNVLMIEHPSNIKKEAENYRHFKKETKLWGTNIVAYSLNGDRTLRKRLLYKNSGFDIVPLRYEGTNRKDMVLYLTNNKYEKFVTLTMYP